MADLYSLLKQFNTIGGIDQTGQSGFCLLMALWQKANGLNWTDRFTMTNVELLYKAGFNCEKTLIEVRNKLYQLGYFKYIKPSNRRKCGTYILNYNLLELCNYLPDVSSEVNSDVSSGVSSDVSSGVNINKPNGTKLNDLSCSKEQGPPTNRDLIGDLGEKYRKAIPSDKHTKGDFPFIGRMYNQHGYDKVLIALSKIENHIQGGFIPDKPLVYLAGMLNNKPKKNADVDWIPEA